MRIYELCCAGKNLNSQFASHSQPTLEAVWRKPAGAQLHAPPKPSRRPERTPQPVPAPPADPAGIERASLPLVQPGEVCSPACQKPPPPHSGALLDILARASSCR